MASTVQPVEQSSPARFVNLDTISEESVAGAETQEEMECDTCGTVGPFAPCETCSFSPTDSNVILDICHPLLDVEKRKTDEDREAEDNMVVKIPYNGKIYRVDFSIYDELCLLPRELKKEVALEDIKKSIAKEEEQKERDEREKEILRHVRPSYANQQKQDEKRSGIVERLRAKLLAKNPLRKDIKNTQLEY